MITRQCSSHPVSIFIAGHASDIEGQCRTFCDEVGLCVTCTPTNFVYKGGEEEGYIVGLINYPRFPATEKQIWDRAVELAMRLRVEAHQDSFTIQAADKTVFYSWREEA